MDEYQRRPVAPNEIGHPIPTGVAYAADGLAFNLTQPSEAASADEATTILATARAKLARMPMVKADPAEI